MSEFNISQVSIREREVLDLMAEGHRSIDVAARLFISDKTVATHKARIKQKCGIQTSVQWLALLKQINPVKPL